MSGSGVEERVLAAVEFLGERIGSAPQVGLVLGSGLGPVSDAFETAATFPYTAIPSFPPATVAGHGGTLVAGRFAGRPALMLKGRYHLYEGYDADTVALPVRVLARLGIRLLVVTNSAGGVNRTYRPGDLMLIDDHINLMSRNPLIGRVRTGEQRFPDMSAPYDRELLSLAEEVALRERVRAVRGVYCALLGPSYETPAEIRMLRALGADAVGMSTVPEVLIARASGVRVLGLSVIANMASGTSAAPVTHDEVLAASQAAAGAVARLLAGVLERVDLV